MPFVGTLPAVRILVTGGSGFLGTHVLEVLATSDHEVRALARSHAAAEAVRNRGAVPVTGDLDDLESIDAAFRASEADVLLNIASLGFGHGPAIVAAAEEAGITRAVFVSTTALFTNLNAPSKAVRTAAEDAIRASGLDWTIVRPTMIYGTPRDRNLWRLLRLLRRTPVVPLPGANKLHQPVHVADLAQAVVAAVERDSAIGKEYDLAGPEPTTLRDLVERSADAVGRQARVIPVPASPIVRALTMFEGTGRRLPISAEQVARLTEDKAFDISAARADLGFDPRPFAEGIAQEAVMEP